MASATAGWDARNILNTARLNPAASRFKCYFQQNRLEPSQNLRKSSPKLCEINLSSTSACLPNLPKPFFVNPLRDLSEPSRPSLRTRPKLKTMGKCHVHMVSCPDTAGQFLQTVVLQKEPRRLLRFQKRPSGSCSQAIALQVSSLRYSKPSNNSSRKLRSNSCVSNASSSCTSM